MSAYSTLRVYGLAATVLVGWWALAFSPAFNQTQLTLNSQHSSHHKPSLLTILSPIHREVLQEALSGDIGLMTQLIADWDIDAQLMEAEGQQAKRLSAPSYLRSQVLGRQLMTSQPQRLARLREKTRSTEVKDDLDKPINLQKPLEKFLPQTYMAASFLLALTNPENIVALPKGLRGHSHLFSPSLTNAIPIDIDQFSIETLHAASPDVAFVAHYSHPSLLKTLKAQEIPLFTLTKMNSLQHITDALIRIGHVINRNLEAELMSHFMEAAMLAIDNRVLALQQSWGDDLPQIVVLNYHLQYALPTRNTLTGQLLLRMGITNNLGNLTDNKDWSVPIGHEQILQLDPDCLIISTWQRHSLEKKLVQDLAFLPRANICFIDETVQQFPSQYIVLAYYDLFDAIVSHL